MQKRQNKHPDPTPWLFLAPSLCGVTLFVLAPFVETVRRSVTDTMGRHFVGLANYTAVLGNDAFRLAVENTVRFIGVCVPLLLALSLCWSLSNYCFIFFWTLPFAWPLLVILMTTGLTALYHHWPGITAFMLPLWVTALLAGIQLHYHTEIRFLILWAIFTAILLYGRRILQRWYDEAWDTHQENMQLIQRLESIANQDALTGTANRRALNAYLAAIWQQKTPLALMMIDVDYFKRYNDRYGHQAGDECLSSVAQVLKMAVRAEGDLVARYGGEEFVVVLPGVSLAHATAIAERIQQKIREAGLPHAASAVASEVTVSIGIVASDGTVPIETLIARADSALYQAKNNGRNQWSY